MTLLIMIRIAEDYEYLQIEEIGKKCLPIYYKYNDLFLLEINDHKIYVIEDDNNLIGFIVFKIHKEEERVHILSIGILCEYRRKSKGSLLINFLKDEYKFNITLYVQTSNETAFKFYTKNGFNIDKTIKNYYQTLDVNDAYFMKFNKN